MADSTDSAQILGSRLKMPTFSGTATEDINQWIKVFDKWCILSNFKDPQKPSLLSFVFVGSAAKILAAWDAADAVPADWTNAKLKIIAQFSDSSRKKVYEATLLRRKLLSSETFDEYYADVISLCSLAKKDMPEIDKIQNVLKGLPENVVQFLLFKDPQSTEDLLRGYSAFKTAKLLTAPISEPNDTAIAAPALTETITAALSSKFESLMVTQNEKINELQALVAKNLSEQKCFRCHKTGHIAKECSLPRTPPPVQKNRNFSQRDRQDHRPSQRRDFVSRDRTPSPYRYESYRSSSPHRSSHPERRRTPSPGNRYYPRESREYRDYGRDYYRGRTPSPYRRDSYSSSSQYPYYRQSEN